MKSWLITAFTRTQPRYGLKSKAPIFFNSRHSSNSSDTKKESDSKIEVPGKEYSVPKPTLTELKWLFLTSAIPFVGFGFIDNFVMIILGDLIDTTMCVLLGFSTMAAAAWGNLFSDTLGIFTGGWVEVLALRFGVRPPKLLPEQVAMSISRTFTSAGSCFGVTIGCILGMFPLLLIDTKEAERRKNEAEKLELFVSILDELATVLEAEKSALFLIDQTTNEMYTKVAEGFEDIRRPVGLGISGKVCATGQIMNLKDAYKSPYFAGEFPSKNGEGFRTKAVLCAPIFGENAKLLGVVEVLNRKNGGHFTKTDEFIIQGVASHIAVQIEGKNADFRRILRLCREHFKPNDRSGAETPDPPSSQPIKYEIQN
eukprot:GHVL01024226.1.p1 GENE.GHVL01024226.1~~GHVL01024226.1.p1  ORF type:complete len:369 (+),score=57.66 GHVL01024226.1:13-1119(+)